MEYRERIEAKVGILFQIADQYLSGQIPLEKAKEQIGHEMVNIRPAQFEAMKVELGERLKEGGSEPKSEKLFELFKSYISPPYNKLQNGHPLRNYFEENCRARAYLLRIDEMEGENATSEDWGEIYESLSAFGVHIKRQEKNFYPLLLPIGMHLQVERAKELGSAIHDEIHKNQERLKNGNIVDFLFHQRSLSQILMTYLDLEERVLYPNVLIKFTDQDFEELRRDDDQDGYAYIEQPAEFTPKEVEKVSADPELILPALLAAKEIGIVYYTLAGEIVSVMGNQMFESDLQMPEEARRELLAGNEKKIKYCYNQGDQTFMITCSIVADALGKYQGLLKTKENISEIKEFTGVCHEKQKKEETAAGTDNTKENREIDATQNIVDLFNRYPKFQTDFYNIDEDLKGMKGQIGMEILKEITVEMLAKSLRMDPADLVDRINKILESY